MALLKSTENVPMVTIRRQEESNRHLSRYRALDVPVCVRKIGAF